MLYVQKLLGADVDWTTKVVNNIFNDDPSSTLNIYYNPSLLINAYLLGLDYTFAGGDGMLIADIAVPVPPSVLLLGSGLLGLGLLGRRRKRG